MKTDKTRRQMKNTHVVIMAGGVGSRFWPMSTPDFPKQFIDVLGVGRTMIQMTVDRLRPMCEADHVWVVTNRRYVETVKEQLPELPDSNILAEPAARNTAPCIAYACEKIARRYPDANVVVTPSDALVLDAEEWRRVVRVALDFTERSSNIVTIGIQPSRPETGYGYIKCRPSEEEVCKVEAFREKPDLATAQRYLMEGGYLWNAGIFVWNVATIGAALRAYAPQIMEIMDELKPHFYEADEREALERFFPLCEKISIDYAVMEKSADIYTIPASFGWSDLGSWGSLRQNSERDADGNALIGPRVEQHDCHGCVVHVSDMGRVVIEGLTDMIVAQKDDRLLICRLASEQHIKEFSQE